ncbi:hypothetical protein BCV72DRAFT_333161 [Rhizopus microsporus var. microsporus]|uniref:Uncharacterized protein n=2 Tax=Rhizopus microsporus TaxID=58291 RepID=A0A2G4T4L8_RHIZD|nr:uncharacterized protein RHIMIDRAFT_288870 [Rhizopus microsporus ATCC 52813]ORE10161.1 hypothetical protein BCV72DRAFT_333161 [Rhizopus microsporus var. microsporus]PHZ15963.1 hypothetical protein RHIMIDRAFT_288870 [Rhizopus microsporus ATCC 52813]
MARPPSDRRSYPVLYANQVRHVIVIMPSNVSQDQPSEYMSSSLTRWPWVLGLEIQQDALQMRWLIPLLKSIPNDPSLGVLVRPIYAFPYRPSKARWLSAGNPFQGPTAFIGFGIYAFISRENTTTGCLRAKTNSELDISPSVSRKFLRLVKHDDILLSNFLIRPFISSRYANIVTGSFVPSLCHGVGADPFLESLSLVHKGSSLLLNSKRYHVFCARGSQLSSGSVRLRPRSWTCFWDIPLPHPGRNARLHLLHDKLPYRSLLHRIIPSAWPDSSYFGEHAFSADRVHSALHQLQFPRFDSLSPILNPEEIFGLALLGIWRSHWLFIFNDTPFMAV